ncbi:hypothetical protein K504DRAFT_501932 [Pleomassaria siparia CBS 279.74]|uniref:Uncharacterized protein n=1 Tax=Pleomassaria siparia CBS 279.74 TaxID=1314801 RepID=A0A6G1K9S9_9PLEO|nr:hypothetical protein K504DRAFT_501932 [Pleomassaria siparia CBS 279.74]
MLLAPDTAGLEYHPATMQHGSIAALPHRVHLGKGPTFANKCPFVSSTDACHIHRRRIWPWSFMPTCGPTLSPHWSHERGACARTSNPMLILERQSPLGSAHSQALSAAQPHATTPIQSSFALNVFLRQAVTVTKTSGHTTDCPSEDSHTYSCQPYPLSTIPLVNHTSCQSYLLSIIPLVNHTSCQPVSRNPRRLPSSAHQAAGHIHGVNRGFVNQLASFLLPHDSRPSKALVVFLSRVKNGMATPIPVQHTLALPTSADTVQLVLKQQAFQLPLSSTLRVRFQHTVYSNPEARENLDLVNAHRASDPQSPACTSSVLLIGSVSRYYIISPASSSTTILQTVQ